MIHISESPRVLMPPESKRNGAAAVRWLMLPRPTANPAATRPTMRRIFSPVRAFWTRAPASRPRGGGEGEGAGCVGPRKERCFAAGGGEGGAELAVAQGAAEGDQAADEPQGEHDGGMVEVFHQQAGRREDAGAGHVGDDDVGQREEPKLALEPVPGSLRGHVSALSSPVSPILTTRQRLSFLAVAGNSTLSRAGNH